MCEAYTEDAENHHQEEINKLPGLIPGLPLAESRSNVSFAAASSSRVQRRGLRNHELQRHLQHHHDQAVDPQRPQTRLQLELGLHQGQQESQTEDETQEVLAGQQNGQRLITRRQSHHHFKECKQGRVRIRAVDVL